MAFESGHMWCQSRHGGCFPGTPLHDGSGVRTPRFAGALASPVPGLSSCIQCVIVLPILQSCFGLSSLPDMGLNATDAPSQIPIKGRKKGKGKGSKLGRDSGFTPHVQHQAALLNLQSAIVFTWLHRFSP